MWGPTRCPCPWAYTRIWVERRTCSGFALPLSPEVWVICLSLWDTFVFLFDLLLPGLSVFFSFSHIYFSLGIWPTSSYDLALVGDRKKKKGTIWKKRGWYKGEWGRNGQREDFELGCYLRASATCSLNSSVMMAPLPPHNYVSQGPLPCSALFNSYLHIDVSFFSRLPAALGEFSIKKNNSSLYYHTSQSIVTYF